MRIKQRAELVVGAIAEIAQEVEGVVEDTALTTAAHGLYVHALPVVGETRVQCLMDALANEGDRAIVETAAIVEKIDAVKRQVDFIAAMQVVNKVRSSLVGGEGAENLDVVAELKRGATLLSTESGCKVDQFRMQGEETLRFVEENAHDDRFRTGTVFDTWSHTGGGELSVLLAPPGVGKTTALVHIGGALADMRVGTVHHFSLEMSIASIVRKYTETIDYTDQRINVSYASPGAMTASRILESVQNECSATGERPACVIVDHISHLASEPGMAAANKFDRMSESVLKLKAMAHELDCPVWTAAQPQRGATRDMRSVPASGTGGYVLGMQDVAECWAIPQVADAIISLNQTEVEREEEPPSVRVHAAKIRNPRPNALRLLTIPATIDYARCRLESDGSFI